MEGNKWPVPMNLPFSQRAAKRGTQKGVGHFFLFRSPFGNHVVTFLTFLVTFRLSPFASPLFRQGDFRCRSICTKGARTGRTKIRKMPSGRYRYQNLLFQSLSVRAQAIAPLTRNYPFPCLQVCCSHLQYLSRDLHITSSTSTKTLHI